RHTRASMPSFRSSSSIPSSTAVLPAYRASGSNPVRRACTPRSASSSSTRERDQYQAAPCPSASHATPNSRSAKAAPRRTARAATLRRSLSGALLASTRVNRHNPRPTTHASASAPPPSSGRFDSIPSSLLRGEKRCCSRFSHGVIGLVVTRKDDLVVDLPGRAADGERCQAPVRKPFGAKTAITQDKVAGYVWKE